MPLCKRIGARAEVDFDHQIRRTFALNYLRAGATCWLSNGFSVHTDLSIRTRYVTFTTVDLAEQHQKSSPATTMLK